ncbi:FAD-dependent thymidylate synthase [Rhizobium ruizarguesonis]
MTISAKIIADSIAGHHRLTTLQLRYPRFIHAEFMTHRVFSRNASSSRAIPVQRLIQDIIDDTARPLHWGKNEPGMQAREEHDSPIYIHDREGDVLAEDLTHVQAWNFARDQAIAVARAFDEAGYHKQIVNRLLEPFSHINVLVSATDWDNFFQLRDHPDAQPEIQVLAQQIKAAMAESKPNKLYADQWHLPYVADNDKEVFDFGLKHNLGLIEVARKVSVARCARVSYRTHDGRRTTVEEDVALHDKLVVAEPLHASPAEHQATPTGMRHRNFNGWKQYRVSLEEAA